MILIITIIVTIINYIKYTYILKFRYPEHIFIKHIELVQKFMCYRINRALKSKRNLPMAYESDWKVKSAARVMALYCNN